MKNGFTLIELLAAFALSVSLATVAMVSYNQFANSQKLNNAALDIVTEIQKAKSRAQTQVKPSTILACQTSSLDGYAIRICTFPNSACGGSGTYEFHIICGNTSTLIERKQLPPNVTFVIGTNGLFNFQVLTAAVEQGSIILTGFGKTKTIQVSGTGNITLQ